MKQTSPGIVTRSRIGSWQFNRFPASLVSICVLLTGLGTFYRASPVENLVPPTATASTLLPSLTGECVWCSGLNGQDTPNDAGGSIILEWFAHPADTADAQTFAGYLVFLAGQRTGPYDSVLRVRPCGRKPDTSAQRIRAAVPVTNQKDYFCFVAAQLGTEQFPSDTIGPVRSTAQWFHTGRVNFLVLTIVFAGVLIYYVERAKRAKLFVRRIAGLDAIEDAVGRATEMGRPILFSFGMSVLNDVTTLAALAIFSRVARKAAEYGTPLISPHEDPMVMAAARENAKQAYAEAGRPDLYQEGNISFLTADQFGYAAGVDGIVLREKPGAVFWQGYFYAEALILAETGNSVGAIQIAGTTSIEQLPFFVVACDYTLIGEEMFAASCYLNPEPQMMGSLKGEDLLKALIMILLVVAALLGTVGLLLSTTTQTSAVWRLFERLVDWFQEV